MSVDFSTVEGLADRLWDYLASLAAADQPLALQQAWVMLVDLVTHMRASNVWIPLSGCTTLNECLYALTLRQVPTSTQIRYIQHTVSPSPSHNGLTRSLPRGSMI